MDVFTLFTTSAYTFLHLGQGGVLGNSTIASYEAEGVFKLRSGLTSSGTSETETSDATLHIKPTETFIGVVGGNLVGQGIQTTVNGNDTTYRIIGVVEGRNYATGALEFYKVTLKHEKLAV